MKLFSTRRRKAIATAVVCATAGLGGLAFAAWLTDSSGEGTTKVGSLQQPTITADGTTGLTGCLPGTDCDANFSINNPNSVDLVITAIKSAVGVPGFVDSGTTNQPACPYTNLTANTKTGLSVAVPKSMTTTVKVPGAFTLASDAPTECQGAQLSRAAVLTFSTTP